MQLGLDFFEHGEMLDDFLGQSVDRAGEVGKSWEEAGRAVRGLGGLLQPAGSEAAGKGARIVVCRADGSSSLSRRRAGAGGGRHCGWTAASSGRKGVKGRRGRAQRKSLQLK